MSSSPDPTDAKTEPPKSAGYKSPGLRGIRTTSLFRAVNPELFIKPNKPVMAFGLLTITLCVSYVAYLNATAENKADLYEAIDSEGTRKALLVTPDGGTPGLPTWYKEPTHALIQQDAHKCILGLGSQIHDKYMEEARSDIKQIVDEVRATMLYWGKKEKEEAVKEALVEAEKEKNEEIKELNKIHVDEIKRAIRKTEVKMQWQQEQMVMKEHEVGKQRLAHEIQQMLHKNEIEKEKAIAAATEKEKQLASQALDQVVIKLKADAETQSQSILQETLEIQKAEYEEKIMAAVAKARDEEKAKAVEPILILQSRHQSEIDMLKKLLCEKEVDLKDVYDKVETMTILELELETELRNTRAAFQDYINVTYPDLAPGQADFLLPTRQMCRDSLTTCKPQKVQKRPQAE